MSGVALAIAGCNHQQDGYKSEIYRNVDTLYIVIFISYTHCMFTIHQSGQCMIPVAPLVPLGEEIWARHV